jgi:hypothetical protein
MSIAWELVITHHNVNFHSWKISALHSAVSSTWFFMSSSSRIYATDKERNKNMMLKYGFLKAKTQKLVAPWIGLSA